MNSMRIRDSFKTSTARLLSSVAVVVFASVGFAGATTPILVTTSADSGEGSLRAALAAAADRDAPARIVIAMDDDIEIDSTLEYVGRQPLEIFGFGETDSGELQSVIASGDFTILAVTEGADLAVSDLGFSGPGGFSIEARSEHGEAAGKGVFVDVRDDQTGVVTLSLTNVVVEGVAGHGVHVSDCDLADDCGGGGGGAGEGSEASIVVDLHGVVIADVGHGRFDADGLRVDERGAGDIHFRASDSAFLDVGADGIELDEGQSGDVVVSVHSSEFGDNGSYCDPEILEAFMPDPDEAEFDDGAAAEADVPGPVEGSPDDSCIEREVDLYDSGSVEAYEFGIDLDDGFDIDEAGPGDIDVVVVSSTIFDNLDEGLDFDEENEGDIILGLVGVSATGNTDDGYKLTEEDDGDVVVTVFGAVAADNGGKGFVFEEEGDGSLTADVAETMTENNDDGDDTGVEAVQEDAGAGVLTIRGSEIADGVDADGVEVSQE